MLKILLFFSFLGFFFCSPEDSDRVSDRILCQFSAQMRKKELFAVGLGGGCNLEKKINLVKVTFDYSKVMDLECARKLITESINHLLDLINSDQTNEKYFAEFPTNVDEVSIGIIGKKPNDGSEYIRTVFVVNGILYYCTDDPTGKVMPFLDIHNETYEEAKKILVDKRN